MKGSYIVFTKRYNIYSSFSIKFDNLELCFDPAKIRKEDIDEICPDYIFISHESMDHMDPAQVYVLQKKKNCKIFCSVACTVDLVQSFPQDTDFINSINTVVPGSIVNDDHIVIFVEKSIHCDYMMPVVFKIIDKKTTISILHCFDSFISEKIVELSKNTDLAIIPIGIAKGVSASTGVDFVKKLHSKMFITNHFKNEEDLLFFKEMVSFADNCMFLDWNDAINIKLTPEFKDNLHLPEIQKDLYSRSIINLISNFTMLRCEIISNQNFINHLFSSYKTAEYDKKIELLVLYTLIVLLDTSIINNSIFENLKNDLLHDKSVENNCLRVVILFFLAVTTQQSTKLHLLEEGYSLVGEESEHICYWVVEFLGRSISSLKNNCESLVDKLLNIISIPHLYNSIVVKRRIFWELHRIMKHLPSLTRRFLKTFEDGLIDQNPDVKLLSVLCFGLANRVEKLSELQLERIFNLLEDDEDDVRETAVKIARGLDHRPYLLKNKCKLLKLLNDKNCHVRNEAVLTEISLKRVV